RGAATNDYQLTLIRGDSRETVSRLGGLSINSPARIPLEEPWLGGARLLGNGTVVPVDELPRVGQLAEHGTRANAGVLEHRRGLLRRRDAPAKAARKEYPLATRLGVLRGHSGRPLVLAALDKHRTRKARRLARDDGDAENRPQRQASVEHRAVIHVAGVARFERT